MANIEPRRREGAKGRPPIRHDRSAWSKKGLRELERMRSRKKRDGTPDPAPYREIAAMLPGRTPRACIQMAYVVGLPIAPPARRKAEEK